MFLGWRTGDGAEKKMHNIGWGLEIDDRMVNVYKCLYD